MGKKKKGRQKSKAAQETAATRTERRAERRAQAIEDHPDAIDFESRKEIVTTKRTEEELRQLSKRNAIWMAILIGAATIWTLWWLNSAV